MALNNTTSANFNTTQSDQAIFLTVFTILLLCSLVGNITLITVIFSNKALKTRFNYLVVNMAISDLFIPFLVIPYEFSNKIRLTDDWPVSGNLGSVMCKLYWFFVDSSLSVSIFSLVAIAANRLVAIVYPVHVGLTNTMNKRSKLFIALTWILAAIVFSPHFFFFKLKGKTCGLVSSSTSKTIYYGFIVFVTYFIPFSIITILYIIIVRKLYKEPAQFKGFLSDTQHRARQKRNKQIFVLSVAIIVSCAVLVGPLFCYIFVLNFIFKWEPPRENQLIFLILNCFYYLYTSSNAIIYFIFAKSFRQGLKRLIFKNKQTREKDGGPGITERFLNQHNKEIKDIEMGEVRT